MDFGERFPPYLQKDQKAPDLDEVVLAGVKEEFEGMSQETVTELSSFWTSCFMKLMYRLGVWVSG